MYFFLILFYREEFFREGSNDFQMKYFSSLSLEEPNAVKSPLDFGTNQNFDCRSPSPTQTTALSPPPSVCLKSNSISPPPIINLIHPHSLLAQQKERMRNTATQSTPKSMRDIVRNPKMVRYCEF
jgi:hypothetical protein